MLVENEAADPNWGTPTVCCNLTNHIWHAVGGANISNKSDKHVMGLASHMTQSADLLSFKL